MKEARDVPDEAAALSDGDFGGHSDSAFDPPLDVEGACDDVSKDYGIRAHSEPSFDTDFSFNSPVDLEVSSTRDLADESLSGCELTFWAVHGGAIVPQIGATGNSSVVWGATS